VPADEVPADEVPADEVPAADEVPDTSFRTPRFRRGRRRGADEVLPDEVPDTSFSWTLVRVEAHP
jgi:hypothetical protein